MKLCMVPLIDLIIIILARCAPNPRIVGPPAAHFHCEVAIPGLTNRNVATSQLFLTTSQVYHKGQLAGGGVPFV